MTRAIFFLEQEFGELLFIRNTRSTQITPFGEQVYADAKLALSQADDLFLKFRLQERTRFAGTVRVALPEMDDFDLLNKLLRRLRDYPEIVLDWRMGNSYSNTDIEQIDVGIRVGKIQDNDFIVKPIAPLTMQTVAAPELLARLGEPQSVDDLKARFPMLGIANANTGRVFEWDFAQESFVPPEPAFIGYQAAPMMQAALAGAGVAQFGAWQVRDAIRAGRLKRVLAEEEITLDWQLYVYRPKRHIQTARVKLVFDILCEELERWFAAV